MAIRDKLKTAHESRALSHPKSARARAILERLAKEYPDAGCSLDYRNEFELIVAVVLSAQCTDAKVNRTLPALFGKYPTAQRMAKAHIPDVEAIVHPLGLFRSKTKNIIALAGLISSGVPRTMAELIKLPGVGRKTANVVLGEIFSTPEGIAVDTHCHRLARRLGLAETDTPEKIERELMTIVPKKRWTMVTHYFIAHGRSLCRARRPCCSRCCVRDLCPSAGMFPE
ncbi:MAG: endonuclease III [Candidatus Hydrogenedentota bacterium]